MDVNVLLGNIDRLIKARKTSQNAVSAKAGRPDAIRNLRRGTIWTLDVLADIADALEVPAWELLRPAGALAQDDGLRDYVLSIVKEANAAPDTVKAPQKRKVR